MTLPFPGATVLPHSSNGTFAVYAGPLCFFIGETAEPAQLCQLLREAEQVWNEYHSRPLLRLPPLPRPKSQSITLADLEL